MLYSTRHLPCPVYLAVARVFPWSHRIALFCGVNCASLKRLETVEEGVLGTARRSSIRASPVESGTLPLSSLCFEPTNVLVPASLREYSVSTARTSQLFLLRRGFKRLSCSYVGSDGESLRRCRGFLCWQRSQHR